MRMLESCLFQARLQNEDMNGLARHEAKLYSSSRDVH
jgi:hypothetical protein